MKPIAVGIVAAVLIHFMGSDSGDPWQAVFGGAFFAAAAKMTIIIGGMYRDNQ